ncbi:MAG: putative quinol monooxygenase [Saezia sp.]
MRKVRVIVSFQFIDLAQEVVLAKTIAFVKCMRLQRGCEHAELLVDVENPGSFTTLELWSNEVAIEEHTTSDYFKEFVTFLAANAKHLQVKRLKLVEM